MGQPSHSELWGYLTSKALTGIVHYNDGHLRHITEDAKDWEPMVKLGLRTGIQRNPYSLMVTFYGTETYEKYKADFDKYYKNTFFKAPEGCGF